MNEQITRLLDSIRAKPAMYWGGGEYPFTSLVAFLAGFKCGACTVYDATNAPEELVPQEFHRFVAERLERRGRIGGKDWAVFIREHTSSEIEAFDLFFKLRKEYESQKPPP